MAGLLSFLQQPGAGDGIYSGSLGLLSLANTIGRPRRMSTNIADVTEPDYSGLRNTLALAQLQRQGMRDRLLAQQSAQDLSLRKEGLDLQRDQYGRQNRLTDMQISEMQRKADLDTKMRGALERIGPLLGPNGELTPEARRELFNAGLGAEVVKNTFTANKPTDDVREYEYAKQQGFKGSLEDWIARKRYGGGEFGMQGYWGVDENTGEPALFQLGKSGQGTVAKMPSGFKLAKDPIKVDAGTDWILLDPQTRQPVGRISKNVAEKERLENVGKKTGEMQFDLPRIEQNAQLALKNIDDLRSHPGLPFAIGLGGWLPAIPNTQQAGAVALFDQLKGKTFLEAYNTLKGGGQITEVEGKKATDAIARLNRAQRRDDVDAALKDLEDVIKIGLERARRQSGQASDTGGWTDLGGGVRIREKR